MGKIKKILENELIGGTAATDVYPVTSIKAVYDENNERLDDIIKRKSIVNISTNYNEDHTVEVLTLAQAIAKVPSSDRSLGFVGTFYTGEDKGYLTYQYNGATLSDWLDTTKWKVTNYNVAEGTGDSETEGISQATFTNEYLKAAVRDTSKKLLFSPENLLDNAEFRVGWSTAESSGAYTFGRHTNQAAAIINVTAGDRIYLQGWKPLWGPCCVFLDSDETVLSGNNSYDVTVPVGAVKMAFTLYRNDNNSNNQTPFDPNTALVVKVTEGMTVPVTRKFNDEVTQEIQDISLEHVKADSEYVTKSEVESTILHQPYPAVFGFENLLKEIRRGKQYANNGLTTDPHAAYSNDITVSAGDMIAIQGFYPKWGYYVTYMNDDNEELVIDSSASSSFGSSADRTIGRVYIVPDNPEITKMGITLWRDDNADLTAEYIQVSFNPDYAIIAKITENTKLPLLNEFKDSLNFSKTKEYRDITENISSKYLSTIVEDSTEDGFITASGIVSTSFSGYRHKVYSVEYTKNYIIDYAQFGGSHTYLVHYYDKGGLYLGHEFYMDENKTWVFENEVLTLPKGTTTIKLNSSVASTKLSSYILIPIDVNDFKKDVDDSLNGLELTKQDVVEVGKGFVKNNGEIDTRFGKYYYWKFNLDTTKNYQITTKGIGGSGISVVIYFNEEGEVVGTQFPVTSSSGKVILDHEILTIPIGTAYCLVNNDVGGSTEENVQLDEAIYSYINVANLKKDVDDLKENGVDLQKTMTFRKTSSSIYIKASFDETRDLVIQYYVNNRNHNVSPNQAILGPKGTIDEVLENGTMVHSSWDSTPPFLLSNYWYLFGEHGYYVPSLTCEGHDKSEEDLLSWWKDANDNEYQLMAISGTRLTFAPKITKNGDGEGRDKRNYDYGVTITGPMTHVSGATHTTNITFESGSGATQWLPFTKNIAKRYFIDGVEVFDNKDYQCDELKVIDIHEGYNPATVTSFNPVTGDTMVRLTFTHRFVGLSVFISNTVETTYPMYMNYYGAFQPMGLRGVAYGGKTYHPMIVIPKVKEASASGRITVDWTKPQDCYTPNQNWAKTLFSNNANDLLAVDDMPERIIEYHKVPDSEDYLIGFAAGYSLISGLTPNEKRKDLTSGCFQFSQDERNKLYIKCMDHYKFDRAVLPAGFVGNFNFYYCYFNPALSPVKTHWYKEGNRYIVYMHSFEAHETVDIPLPEAMDGMVVQSIIENTDGSSLKTDTVAGGKLIAKFPEGSNYIVAQLG